MVCVQITKGYLGAIDHRCAIVLCMTAVQDN